MEQQPTNRQENNQQSYEYSYFYTQKVLTVAPVSKAKDCDANCNF